MEARREKEGHWQRPLRRRAELLPVLSPAPHYPSRREQGEPAGEGLCSPPRAGDRGAHARARAGRLGRARGRVGLAVLPTAGGLAPASDSSSAALLPSKLEDGRTGLRSHGYRLATAGRHPALGTAGAGEALHGRAGWGGRAAGRGGSAPRIPGSEGQAGKRPRVAPASPGVTGTRPGPPSSGRSPAAPRRRAPRVGPAPASGLPAGFTPI